MKTRASLSYLDHSKTLLSIDLQEAPVTLGRMAPADVILQDSKVSPLHARVGQIEGAWYIDDLESINGTKVNAVRVSQRTWLKPNDMITCGTREIFFCLVSSADNEWGTDPALRGAHQESQQFRAEKEHGAQKRHQVVHEERAAHYQAERGWEMVELETVKRRCNAAEREALLLRAAEKSLREENTELSTAPRKLVTRTDHAAACDGAFTLPRILLKDA